MDQEPVDRSASEQSSARNLKMGAIVLLVALIFGTVMAGVGMRHNIRAPSSPVAQNTGPPAPSETRGQGSPQESTPQGQDAPQGPMTPQGPTGPLDTKSGGAPAASPQGETPPGMQSAPRGSNEKM